MASINSVTIDLKVRGEATATKSLKDFAKANEKVGTNVVGLANKVSAGVKEFSKLDAMHKQGIITENARKTAQAELARQMSSLTGLTESQTRAALRAAETARKNAEETRRQNAERQRAKQSYDQLRAVIDQSYAARMRLKQAADTLRAAERQGLITRQQAIEQLRQYQAAARAAGAAGNMAARRTNQLGVLMQQTGYQVGDFAVQVQSGTDVMVALGQQLTQLVGTFGMLSQSTIAIAFFAALGIAVPIVTALAGAMMRVESSAGVFDEMASVLRPIEPLLTAISSAMSTIAEASIDFANLIVNNLDRIIVTATTAAALFAGKFVAAFVLARVTTFSLVAALTVLRGALIRTGIGALIVGAGELVYQFTRLVKGAGGFGNALKLLVNVASGVWTDIGNGATGLWNILKGVSKAIQSAFVSAFAVIGQKWDALVNGMANAWNSIAGTEFGKTLGFGTMGVSNVGGRLGSAAAGLEAEAIASIEKGGALLKSAKNLENTAEAWGKLKEAMAQADEEGRNIDIRDWFGGTVAEDEDGGGGGGATDKVSDALTEMQQRIQSLADTIKDSMSEAFMSIVEGTKSAKDAFRDMARAVLKQLFDILVVQQLVGSFDVGKGTGSGIVGGIMKLFGSANGNAFSGGNVIPFANGGIVSSPTLFPMRGNQTGLMGEAGPEAIMPLKRGKGGKLGVVAEGSSQPVNIYQTFQFSANGDDSVKRIIAQEAPKIANLTQKQVLEARSRGGAFRTTFGA